MKDASEPDAPVPPRNRSSGLSAHRSGRWRNTIWRVLGVTIASLSLLLGAAIPAAAADLARITFVRHGESAGNASGKIDTSTPGPVLTALGQQQAQDVVDTLGDNNYDGVYASTMVRTQLTAAPMSQYLRLPIQVLAGLQEIEAGVFEGTPEADAANGYAKFPLAWAFQETTGPNTGRNLRIPRSIDGNEFDARVDGALKTIYDSGDRNAVVFSHGGAIMFWTMMNVSNLTMEQKINLLRTAALDNTDYVVIEGNPEDGWTLVNWNGQQFSPEPTLGAEVKLQLRTLTRQLQATTKQIVDAFATRNVGQIVTALNRGIADAVFSVAKFTRAVNAKIIHEVSGPGPSTEAPETSTVTASAKVAASALADSTTDTMADDGSNAGDTVTALRARTAARGDDSKAVEATRDDDATEDASNGATNLGDGNKAEPGEQSTAGDTDAADGSDTDDSDTGSATPSGGEAGTSGAGDDGGDSGAQSDAA